MFREGSIDDLEHTMRKFKSLGVAAWMVLFGAGGVGATWLIGAERPAAAQTWSDEEEVEESDLEGDDDTNLYDRMGGRELSPKDIDRLTRILKLTDEQKPAVTDLLAAYQAKRTDASQKINEFQKSLSEKYGGGYESGNAEFMKEMQEAYEKYGKHQEKLREGVVSDVKAVLSDEQAGNWDKVERWLRRGRQLARTFGMTGASRIDLTAMIERGYTGTDIPEGIAQTLDSYEIEADRLLKDHEAYQKKAEEEFAQKRKDNPDMTMADQMEAQKTIMVVMAKQSKDLREINMRTMKKILGMIEPAEKQAEFEAEFLKKAAASPYAGFMRQGKKAGLDAGLRAAEKLDDLTNEQKERLAAIRKSVKTDRMEMDRKTFEEGAKKEDEIIASGTVDWTNFGVNFMDEGRKRGEWEKKYVEQVKGLLTAAQLEKMPPPLKPVEAPKVEFEE